MNADLIQTYRYNLQKRVRRLARTRSDQRYLMTLRQFWNFLKRNPFFQGTLDDLRARNSAAVASAEKIANGSEVFSAETEEQHAALALSLIQLCVDSRDVAGNGPIFDLSYRLGRVDGGAVGGYVEQFHELLTEPLYEYLDEYLDDRRAVLGFLIRYKRRCEWFHRDRLHTLWATDPRRGEKRLAADMYEYLYEQGLEFTIEPSSVSGEADLVSTQVGESRLVADAKIFDPEKGKSTAYIAAGFHQVCTYTQDYNESVGYLIVFQTGDSALQLSLPDTVSSIPFVVYNNKTIFILLIDIRPDLESASQRGRLTAVPMCQGDFITASEGTQS